MSIMKNYFSFIKKYKFTNKSNKWMNYSFGDMELSIQPKFTSNELVDSNVDKFLIKISKLSKKYFLFHKCSLYSKSYQEGVSVKSSHIKFRLSDSEAMDSNIPQDIRLEIISDVHNEFSGYHIDIDDFPDRGYIIFDIIISL